VTRALGVLLLSIYILLYFGVGSLFLLLLLLCFYDLGPIVLLFVCGGKKKKSLIKK